MNGAQPQQDAVAQKIQSQQAQAALSSMASNGSAGLMKKRKKDGLKPIITAESPQPGYASLPLAPFFFLFFFLPFSTLFHYYFCLFLPLLFFATAPSLHPHPTPIVTWLLLPTGYKNRLRFASAGWASEFRVEPEPGQGSWGSYKPIKATYTWVAVRVLHCGGVHWEMRWEVRWVCRLDPS